MFKNILKIILGIAFLFAMFYNTNMSEEEIQYYQHKAQQARDHKCSNLPMPKPYYCNKEIK